ncbi:Probable RNA-directed DNA polymerase from transposon BS [Eumeta japonica]|uniref:Probable RNA-directed DNA polymerase from transposon BS n=1 Tax=Eumeta variegata TaxID=151549 RepID=A0A4C2A4V6_EUMVA|nr:Probable RNA-directed DNA polymerase from transposon BS [Eumeta japonica]
MHLLQFGLFRSFRRVGVAANVPAAYPPRARLWSPGRPQTTVSDQGAVSDRRSATQCHRRIDRQAFTHSAPRSFVSFHTLICGCRYGTEALPHARASSRRGYDPDGSIGLVRTIFSGIIPVPSPHRPRARAVRERARSSRMRSQQVEGGHRLDGWYLTRMGGRRSPSRTRSRPLVVGRWWTPTGSSVLGPVRCRAKIDTPPLNSIPDDIRTTEQIDHAIGALTSHVRTVVKRCEREVPASSDRRKFPPDILELIRAKNKALRRASAYPTPEYRSRARALQREVKARVQEFRNESWSDLMEEIRPSHKAFWKITKALKTEGYTPIPPLKRPDGSTALDDAEVAECIADSIETQCSHASPPHDTAHISRIEEEVLQKTSLEPRDDLTPVSLSEVQTLVKSLKTRKAPGLDGISNKAIKCFPQQLLSLLVAIFNACLQNCYFPPVWKEAEVIGIHKPGKPRDLPASYRPISLLSGLSKLYERLLKTRLTDHLLGKGLIIDDQFGFRPAHSCPQQVLRLVEYATEGFKRKNKTVAVFFDVAKAFDRVWHAGLVYKLYSLHVPDRLVLIIQNYLSNRHFTFRHERTHSTRESSSGLRSERSRYSALAATAPVRGRAVRCARVGHRRAALRCGLPHRVRVPRGPLPSFCYTTRPVRCMVVASRNPTWRCGSV